MKVDLFNQKGKSEKKFDLPDGVFADKVNEKLLSQYVYIYLSNQREPIAHTKDRGDVSGGGRKPFRQKGTGRARAGSNRSPIWTGGGVTFGPTNRVNWKKTMPRKAKTVAMRSALSHMIQQGSFRVLEALSFDDSKPLTKQAKDMLKAFGNPKKVTIVMPSVNKQVLNAFGSLPEVKITTIGELSAYDVLNAGELIVLADAVEYTYTWEKATE